MNLDDIIEETMDADMQSYTETEAYRFRHSSINRMISDFRDDLTSKKQQERFLQIINLLSDEHADFSVNAYGTAFRAGMAFKEQDLER